MAPCLLGEPRVLLLSTRCGSPSFAPRAPAAELPPSHSSRFCCWICRGWSALLKLLVWILARVPLLVTVVGGRGDLRRFIPVRVSGNLPGLVGFVGSVVMDLG